MSSQRWRDEDRISVNVSDVPTSLRTTLSDSRYTGWEKSTIWRNKSTNEYLVEIKDGSTDPVLALASKEKLTAFVRVMILPRELLGKSSIRYVRPEDADKPKLQTYRLFADEPIPLKQA